MMTRQIEVRFIALIALLLGGLLAVAPAGAEPILAPLTPADFAPGVLLPGTTEGSGFASQTFVVPTEGTTITFNVNILTVEPWGAPPENDYLFYGLFNPAATLITPLSGPVTGTIPLSSLTVTPFSSYPTYVVGPHGETYLGQSGVFTVTLPVPASLAGTSAQLGIAVFDMTDGIGNTGAIIDNIVYPGTGGNFTGGPATYFGIMDGGYAGSFHSLTVGGLDDFPLWVDKTGFAGGYVHISTGPDELAAIPEPGTLLLLGSGLLGVGAWARRRSRG